MQPKFWLLLVDIVGTVHTHLHRPCTMQFPICKGTLHFHSVTFEYILLHVLEYFGSTDHMSVLVVGPTETHLHVDILAIAVGYRIIVAYRCACSHDQMQFASCLASSIQSSSI